MGTTGYMVMANMHPELQDKIILANLLAPVAYVGEMKSPIRLIAPFANSLEVKWKFDTKLINIEVSPKSQPEWTKR